MPMTKVAKKMRTYRILHKINQREPSVSVGDMAVSNDGWPALGATRGAQHAMYKAGKAILYT